MPIGNFKKSIIALLSTRKFFILQLFDNQIIISIMLIVLRNENTKKMFLFKIRKF